MAANPGAHLIPKGWLPLAEEARRLGIPERTMRYRLVALHQRLGGGVLRAFNAPGRRVGKWFFNPVALEASFASDPDPVDASLGEHALRIEELEKNLLALRNAHRDLKNRVKRNEQARANSVPPGNPEQSGATADSSLIGPHAGQSEAR